MNNENIDDLNCTNNSGFCIIAFICFFLLTINGLELKKIYLLWLQSLNKTEDYYNTCVLPDLFVKSISASFSFLFSLSVFTLVLVMLFFNNSVLRKCFSVFLHVNYLFFGILLLGFSTLGLIFWNSTTYSCLDQIKYTKIFSFSNAFS